MPLLHLWTFVVCYRVNFTFFLLLFITSVKLQLYSLWIKPTDALNSSFIGITTVNVSGSLSDHHQEFLVVHRLWFILCNCEDCLLPGAGWHCSSILLLVANGSSQLHKMYQSRCTTKNSWWWAERLSETCRVVILIKLEFGASVGFVHKESVTMHGHTIVKFQLYVACSDKWLLRHCLRVYLCVSCQKYVSLN